MNTIMFLGTIFCSLSCLILSVISRIKKSIRLNNIAIIVGCIGLCIIVLKGLASHSRYFNDELDAITNLFVIYVFQHIFNMLEFIIFVYKNILIIYKNLRKGMKVLYEIN